MSCSCSLPRQRRPSTGRSQLTIYPLYLVPLTFYRFCLFFREPIYLYALMFRPAFQLRHVWHHLIMYAASSLRLGC